MSKAITKTLVPKLRFPEFVGVRRWDEKPLKKVADVRMGTSPKSEFYNEDFVGLPLIQGNADIKDRKSNPRVFTSEITRECFYGDILLSVRAPVGEVSISMHHACIGRGVSSIRASKENNQNFLYQFFLFFESRWSKFSQGSTFEAVNSNDIKDLKVSIPLPAEQQKIADCLSSIDDLITAHTQKHKALKAHKKGMMQQLFPAEGESVPKLRFPEFRGVWKRKKLIDTADKKIRWSFIGGPFGSNLKSSDYVSNGVRIIQLQNIGDSKFNDDYKIFTSEQKADELLANNIYPNDIILSKMGDPVGRACLIPNNHERYVMCSDGIRLAVDESRYNKYFIYSLINSIQFRSMVENTATGSTRKRIGLDQLKKLPMLIPDIKEQQKIADCLFSIDEQITAQAKKIKSLKSHKKGLMQQLFPTADGVNG